MLKGSILLRVVVAAVTGALTAWAVVAAGRSALASRDGELLHLERIDGRTVVCGRANQVVFCRDLHAPQDDFRVVAPGR